MVRDISRGRVNTNVVLIAVALVGAAVIGLVARCAPDNPIPRSSAASSAPDNPTQPAPEFQSDTPMSTAAAAPSISTDPNVPALPAPQPPGSVPAEPPVPWSTPPPLPNDLAGASDPADAYSPPLTPAALGSAFGQRAYAFIIAFTQAFTTRDDWNAEWIERITPYVDPPLIDGIKKDAGNFWLATETFGLTTYNPVVMAVYVLEDGPTNATFLIQVATQSAPNQTATPVMAYANVKTWQVTLSAANDPTPVVVSVLRLDPEDEVIGVPATGQD